MVSDRERFMRFVEPIPESGCWLWTGGLWRGGYGQFRINKRPLGAHRAAYLFFKESLDPDKVIDHKCRVHCCVNPDHLELVTSRENIMRGLGEAAKNIAKTHCKRGHSLEQHYTTVDGRRQCHECRKMYSQNYCERNRKLIAERQRRRRNSLRGMEMPTAQVSAHGKMEK